MRVSQDVVWPAALRGLDAHSCSVTRAALVGRICRAIRAHELVGSARGNGMSTLRVFGLDGRRNPTEMDEARSCDDDELSGRVIRFHGSVCLGNLIEAVHVIDGYDGVAGGNGVEKLLQYSLG